MAMSPEIKFKVLPSSVISYDVIVGKVLIKTCSPCCPFIHIILVTAIPCVKSILLSVKMSLPVKELQLLFPDTRFSARSKFIVGLLLGYKPSKAILRPVI